MTPADAPSAAAMNRSPGRLTRNAIRPPSPVVAPATRVRPSAKSSGVRSAAQSPSPETWDLAPDCQPLADRHPSDAGRAIAGALMALRGCQVTAAEEAVVYPDPRALWRAYIRTARRSTNDRTGSAHGLGHAGACVRPNRG